MSWDIPVNANLSFPFLTSLSLDVLGLEDDNAVPLFLSPTILPSLRYLTLSGTKDGPSVFPPIRPPLFQQLELLHVQNNGHAPGLDLSPYASAVCPILFDLRFNGPLGHPGDEELPLFRPSTAHVRHLALSLDDAISERIPFIVDSLPKSNLRTLFLPLEWDTPDSLQAGATGD